MSWLPLRVRLVLRTFCLGFAMANAANGGGAWAQDCPHGEESSFGIPCSTDVEF